MKKRKNDTLKTKSYIIEDLINFYKNTVNYERFRHCNAYISEVIFNSACNITFRLIKSYNTIVGFVNLDTCEYIELGKWSTTTSKQVTQIYNAHFYNSFERKYIDLEAVSM